MLFSLSEIHISKEAWSFSSKCGSGVFQMGFFLVHQGLFYSPISKFIYKEKKGGKKERILPNFLSLKVMYILFFN